MVKLWEITRGLVTENYGEVSDVHEPNNFITFAVSVGGLVGVCKYRG